MASLRPGGSLGATFVKVKGTRLGRYVEFDFILNDDDLTIELILPIAAFEEFCRMQNATVLPAEAGTAEEIERLAWRAGQPGLLRKTTGGGSATNG